MGRLWKIEMEKWVWKFIIAMCGQFLVPNWLVNWILESSLTWSHPEAIPYFSLHCRVVIVNNPYLKKMDQLGPKLTHFLRSPQSPTGMWTILCSRRAYLVPINMKCKFYISGKHYSCELLKKYINYLVRLLKIQCTLTIFILNMIKLLELSMHGYNSYHNNNNNILKNYWWIRLGNSFMEK